MLSSSTFDLHLVQSSVRGNEPQLSSITFIIFVVYSANIQIKNENPKFKWSSQKSGFLTQNNFFKILCYVNVNIQIKIE